MVLAHHIIIAAYGFWLPNDPRGSWSNWVRKWELRQFGPATKTDTRRSVASTPHDRTMRVAAKKALSYPPVHFTGNQAKAIAEGFATAIHESAYRCVACAILPEHAHLVMLRHERTAETMMTHLKSKASMRLREQGLHPFLQLQTNDALPSPWARQGWKVFLNSEGEVRRAIEYVVRNPEKEGKRRQVWSFVGTFEG